VAAARTSEAIDFLTVFPEIGFNLSKPFDIAAARRAFAFGFGCLFQDAPCYNWKNHYLYQHQSNKWSSD
jgi:hypothetical protein